VLPGVRLVSHGGRHCALILQLEGCGSVAQRETEALPPATARHWALLQRSF
jgi:hypothetical protein